MNLFKERIKLTFNDNVVPLILSVLLMAFGTLVLWLINKGLQYFLSANQVNMIYNIGASFLVFGILGAVGLYFIIKFVKWLYWLFIEPFHKKKV